MSEFMESFKAKPEQIAAHEAQVREITRLADEMKERIIKKYSEMRKQELTRDKKEWFAELYAKAAIEVSEQLNKDIDGMIEEQMEQDKAA